MASVERLELLWDKPAGVFRDGSRVPLTLRRAEIISLLDSRTQGWTAEELAYELYSDAGRPQGIRIEMFRVRSILGGAVESNPYRVRHRPDWLLGFRAGPAAAARRRVADAQEAYTAPLPSRSVPWQCSCFGTSWTWPSDPPCGPVATPGSWSGGYPRMRGPQIQKLGRLVGCWDARYLSFRASAGVKPSSRKVVPR
ncbi:hypothetical protein M1D88_04970 [Arthrobacter sp. R1-13]